MGDREVRDTFQGPTALFRQKMYKFIEKECDET